MQAELDKLGDSTVGLGGAASDTKGDLEDMGSAGSVAFTGTGDAAADAEDDVTGFSDSVADASAAATDLAEGSGAAAIALSATGSSADDASSSIESMGGKAEESGGKSEILATGAGHASSAAKDLLSSMTRLGKWSTAGLIGAGAASLYMAGDFQAAGIRLVTTAGESKGALQGVEQTILNMSTSVGQSSQALLQAAYTVESAGFHGFNAMTVLKASAEGATEEQANLGDVTNAVTSVLKAYNMSASQSTSVVNEMLTAVSRGKMTFQDLASAIPTVLPVAHAAGVSFSQVAAAIATMSAQGTSAQEAAQNVAQTIRDIQDPSQQSVQMLQQLGLSSVDLAQNLGTRGLTGTIQMVETAIAQHMGPSGLVMLNTLKQSQAAAQDAQLMIQKMPASLQKLAEAYIQGKITSAQWNQEMSYMGQNNSLMAQQFSSVAQQAEGFNNLLTSGSPAAQTFAQTLETVMGNSTSLNVALQVGGSHMADFQSNASAVAAAGGHAGKNVQNWGMVQKEFNFQLKNDIDTLDKLGIEIGFKLMPYFNDMVKGLKDAATWFEHNKDAAEALGIVVGTILAASMALYIGKLLQIDKIAKGIFSIGKGAASGLSWISEQLGFRGPSTTAPATGAGATSPGSTFLSQVEEAGEAFITAATEAGIALKNAAGLAATETEEGATEASTTINMGAGEAATKIETSGTEAGTAMTEGGTETEGSLIAGGTGFGKVLGPVLAFAIGTQIGDYLNQKFGLSKKIDNWIMGPNPQDIIPTAMGKISGAHFKDETAKQQLAILQQLLTAVQKGQVGQGQFGALQATSELNNFQALIIEMMRHNPDFKGSGKVGKLTGVPQMAHGGVVTGPTLLVAGEQGEEYIIPKSMLSGAMPSGNPTIGALPPGTVGANVTVYEIANLVVVAQNPAQMEQQLKQRSRTNAISSKPGSVNLAVAS